MCSEVMLYYHMNCPTPNHLKSWFLSCRDADSCKAEMRNTRHNNE